MDRTKVKMLRAAMEKELKAIEEKFKVQVDIGKCTYTDSNCTFKVEFADVGDNGEVKSKEVEDFRLYASMYGLKPDDLGKIFSTNGEEYEITGLSTRKRKYPILGTRIKDGAKFKFPVSQVQFGLKMYEDAKGVK